LSVPPTTPIDPLTLPWRPTVDDVAALLRARTKDASGNELGTFTPDTRPTDVEVELLITNGCAKVASYVGWDLPDECVEEGRHLATLVAAYEAELSYWPEQVLSNRSPASNYWAMFEANIAQFEVMVGVYLPDSGVGQRIGSLPTPSSTVVFAYTWGFGFPTMSDVVNVGMPPGTSSRSRSPAGRRARR